MAKSRRDYEEMREQEHPPVGTDRAVSTVVPARTLTVPKGSPLGAALASFEKDTLAGKARLIAALTAPDYAITDGDTARINAVAWAVVPVEKVDEETGEVSQWTNLVFFDRENRIVKTSSAVVAHQLSDAMGLFTQEDWARGIPFIIRARRSKNGRTYHELRIAGYDAPTVAPGGEANPV